MGGEVRRERRMGSERGGGGGEDEAERKRRKAERRERRSALQQLAVQQQQQGPQCYGCGAALQTRFEGAAGYVPTGTYETKRRHRQLASVLCGRCRALAHGRMVAAVTGHGGYKIATRGGRTVNDGVDGGISDSDESGESGEIGRQRAAAQRGTDHDADLAAVSTAGMQADAAKASSLSPTHSLSATSATAPPTLAPSPPPPPPLLPPEAFVTAEQLRQQLTAVRRHKALVVKLVDVVDFSGSFLSRFREIIGANPVILGVTKVGRHLAGRVGTGGKGMWGAVLYEVWVPLGGGGGGGFGNKPTVSVSNKGHPGILCNTSAGGRAGGCWSSGLRV